jgi:hypothetical protein
MTVNCVGRVLYREFESQSWRRTAIACPPRVTYLSGKCMAVFVVGLSRLTIFALIAVTVLGLPLAGTMVAGAVQLAVVLVAFAATARLRLRLRTLIRRAEVFFPSYTWSWSLLGGPTAADEGVSCPGHWADDAGSPQ